MAPIPVDHSRPKQHPDVIEIDLRTASRKVLFGAIGILLVALYAVFVFRPYLAARSVRNVDRASIASAIHLAPGDAEYPAMMGAYLLLSGNSADTLTAIRNLETATALNPHSSHYWLNLARANWFSGNAAGVANALARAAEAEPTSPAVAWERALFYLAGNDFDQAMPNIRLAVANDPTLTADALRVCWSATHDASKLLALGLPATAAVRLSFLHMMTARSDIPNATIAWRSVLDLTEDFDPRAAFDYLDLLLRNNRSQEASAAWEQLAERFTALKPYSADGGVVNGGFELDVLGGGFDWQQEPAPHVTSNIDTETFHSGTRSLCVSFEDGANDAGIAQRIAVQPNANYNFSAWVKADRLLTHGPPRFLIYDPATQIALLAQSAPIGSTPWRQVMGSLHTGPTTSLVQLRIDREPPRSDITGRLCVDDVTLTKQ